MEKERKNWVLGVRKIIRRRQRCSRHIHGKGWQGGARVHQKFYLPYLDSEDDNKEKERWKGNSDK